MLNVELIGLQPVNSEQGWRARSEEVSVRVPFREYLEDDSRPLRSARYQASPELRARLAAGEFDEASARKVRYELHHRVALSAAFLMFLGLGASTGLILRRGTQLGALAVAVGYALGYYILSMRFGKSLAAGGVVPPETAAWATIAVGCVVAVVLLQRALRR